MSNPDELLAQYRDAVRLHIWYSGSPYGFHAGKVDRDQAKYYRRLAHKLHAERRELLK